MASPVPDFSRVRFGPFELDPSAERLFKSGIPRKLQPQPFRVLLLLASRPGQVVSREEIQRHLWGDSTFVDFERGINFSINQIRAALGDEADKPRYIETLPRIGYRFVALIEPDTEGRRIKIEPQRSAVVDNRTDGDTPHWLGKRRLIPAAAVLIVVLIGLWVIWKIYSSEPLGSAIAVLPFQNASSDKEIDFLRVALQDEIVTTLSSVPSLSIRPSLATNKYNSPDVDLNAAGRAMHVGKIVTGHYLKQGAGAQVTLELVDVHSSSVIWRDALTTSDLDLIGVQEAITAKVRYELLPKLGITAISETMTHPHNEKAYASYLQSIPMSHDPGPNAAALQLLENSVKVDPDFAPAWEALGLRYGYEATYANGGENARAHSDDAYQHALDLEPDRIVAAGQLITNWVDRRQSQKAYTFAQDLVKKYPASAQAHFVLSYVYRYRGTLDLSAKECNTALNLDPGNYSFRSCAWTFTELGQGQRARDFLQLDAGSSLAAYGMATAFLDEGKVAEAREVVKNISANPYHLRDLLGSCLQLQPAANLDSFAAAAEASIGGPIDPEVMYYQGAILAYCGKQDSAGRLLAGAISANYCAYTALQTDPLLLKFRETPAYSQLLSTATRCERDFVAQPQ